MTKPITAEEVEKSIRALITAETTNLGIEVAVPVAYGDGEFVTVVVEQSGEGFMAHDAGFSAMRLSGSGITLSTVVKHRLIEFAKRYRCEFSDGRVFAPSNLDELPQVICLVANAARAVADYVYEIRRYAEHDFHVIVFEKVREIVGERAHEADEFKGQSGRKYRLPFILNKEKTQPQILIATIASRAATSQSFTALYDLGQALPFERDAVVDDEAGLRDEDRSLLRSSKALVYGWYEAERHFKEVAADAPRH